MARPRVTPVFTVEIKRSKQTASDTVRWPEPPRVDATAAAKTWPFAETVAGSAQDEASEISSASRPARRVLPDLVTAEALEQRVSDAFAARLRGGRAPSRDDASAPVDSEPVVKPKPAKIRRKATKTSRPAANPAPATPSPAQAPAPLPSAAAPSGEERTRPRRYRVRAATQRAAERRGQPVVFRAGERWKRRLPYACR